MLCDRVGVKLFRERLQLVQANVEMFRGPQLGLAAAGFAKLAARILQLVGVQRMVAVVALVAAGVGEACGD